MSNLLPIMVTYTISHITKWFQVFQVPREEFALTGDQEDADGGGLPNQKKKIRVMSELSLQPVFP